MEDINLDFDDESLNRLIRRIYQGKLSKRNLPLSLYAKTANALMKALDHGFYNSRMSYQFSDKDIELAQELRDNIYFFSGAKTYQQVREFGEMLADQDGTIRPFREFKKLVKERFTRYNEQYLSVEYDTAIGMAQNGLKWNDIDRDKDIFPYLQYDSVMDSRTTQLCQGFENITLPVDDPFWRKYMPPNHWRCRSIVHQIDKYEDVKLTPPEKAREIENRQEDHVPDLFKMNPGIDKVVFKTTGPGKHPYFQVEPEDKSFAQQNFHLPIHNFRLDGFGPKGKEVHKAFSQVDPKMQDIFSETLQAINAVHGDGELPVIPLEKTYSKKHNGVFYHNLYRQSVSIHVNPLSKHPHLTLAHEIGHFIDFNVLNRPGYFASAEGQLAPFVEACKKTSVYTEIEKAILTRKINYKGQLHPVRGKVLSHLQYLNKPEELWARAYAQYIAEKSNSPVFFNELKKSYNYTDYGIFFRQWTEEEFKPIAEEIDKLFKSKGWIRKLRKGF